MKTFIKDESILDETYEMEDLFDFSAAVQKFNSKINHISKSAQLGLVGPYGSGKSTMLYQLSRIKDKNVLWIHFDAWKFPERSNLWEGFVLEFIRSAKPEMFEKIRKEIDGEKGKDVQSLISVLAQGANLFVPGMGIAENFNKLFHSSPAKRVYQLQEILEKFINNEIKEENVYIIIEDIDRSGDNGIFFLETFSHFIKNTNFNKKILGIVPISNKNYDLKKEEYLKPLDYIESFKPEDIDFTNFVKTSFEDDVFLNKPNAIIHLQNLFSVLVQNHGWPLREFKNFLRNAHIEYKTLDDYVSDKIDVRLFLVFAALKQLKKRVVMRSNDKDKINFADQEWLKHLLINIANEQPDLGNYRTDFDFIFADYNEPLPTFNQHSNWKGSPEGAYMISDMYKRIFNFK